ncbi:MAG: hypothetical protein V4543_06745 [Bacteroidota bacterium]
MLQQTDRLRIVITEYLSGVTNFFTSGRYWAFKAAFLCYILGYLTGGFSSPSYVFNTKLNYDVRVLVSNQIEHPFTQQNNFREYSHEGKRAFRLSTPLLAKVLGLNVIQLIWLQQAAAFGVFVLFALLITRITGSREAGYWACMALAFNMYGKRGLLDWECKLDGYMYFYLMAAIYFRKPWLLAFFAFMLGGADERGLFAGIALIVYHQVAEKRESISNFFKPSPQALGILSGLVLSVSGRVALMIFTDLKVGHGNLGIEVMVRKIDYLIQGIYSGMEAFNFFLLPAAAILLFNRKYILFLAWAGTMAISIVLSIMVSDITRSICLTLPAIITALVIIERYQKSINWGKYMFWCMAVCFFYGSYEVSGPIMLPLILKVFIYKYNAG